MSTSASSCLFAASRHTSTVRVPPALTGTRLSDETVVASEAGSSVEQSVQKPRPIRQKKMNNKYYGPEWNR